MRHLKRAAVALLVTAVCIAATPVNPRGVTIYVNVSVKNDSNKSAWSDISESYKLRANWKIEKAFCIKPGGTFNYKIAFNYPEFGPQVRVRSEVKSGTGECDGHQIAYPKAQVDMDTHWVYDHQLMTHVRLYGTDPYAISMTDH